MKMKKLMVILIGIKKDVTAITIRPEKIEF